MEKESAFQTLQADPFNGGTPVTHLTDSYLTPAARFFVRNHAPVPAIDPAAYRLRVGGMVAAPLSLALSDLGRFGRRRVVAALQCAGNRRVELQTLAPIPDELIWDTQAVGNAEWGGVLLADILRLAGVPDDPDADLHVAFEGLDCVSDKDERFGGSIPLRKALDGGTLLADSMNGAPLSPAHGFPLRALVPGWIGARSVKWLTTITVQESPSDNYYQAHAYKWFPSDVRAETVDWSRGMMLGELNLNTLIGQVVPAAGGIIVRGVALAGERAVERVEVSADGGKVWIGAEMLDPGSRYGWRRWQARVSLAAGEYEIAARAWDSAAATQPERLESVWNFKGYMNNAYHRVRISV
jgi:sulfite oxidase